MKRDITQLLSPDPSQSLSHVNGNKKLKSKKVQAILNFPSSSPTPTQSTTCSTCGMTYYFHVSKDKELHKKYHASFMSGISWPTNFVTKRIEAFTIIKENTPTKKNGLIKTNKVSTSSVQAEIISLDKKSTKQIKKVEEILDMVNKELNAPLDSRFWQKEAYETSKAFLVIIDNKAIGVCVTDPINNVNIQCRWMVHRTQSVVPNQINKQIRIGISRIWIAPKWRRQGLAKRLLEVVLTNSIYGITLNKREIGFSQPSHSGGLLAKNFNGVTHKSGEILIPVYLED